MAKNNILVTGCAGFIGSNLTSVLLEKGNKVIGIDNFDPFYDRKIKEHNLSKFLSNKNFSFAELDLSDAEALRGFCKDIDIDIIVHLAGKAGVRPSIETPGDYIKANIVGTQNILDVMRENGIKKLAFASSSSVYGNKKVTPFHEDMDVSNPVSPYASTKKSCELINYTYHHLYGIDVMNLRLFTVFGPGQRPDLAIHSFVKLITAGEEIKMFGDGTTARDYTYVDDTVGGIEAAVEYLFNNEKVFEIVNLGNNKPVKLKDMIQVIGEQTGLEPKIKQMPMQPGDVDITYADISKAQKLLGYKPQTPFREGVKKFVEWYNEQCRN
jgi:nucleoside-diphosphate-sugar epimerase